jgi:hypothetical protein
MAMLDDNPVLKERLMAFGAFAGIGLFAVAAVDVMITGGFDFGPARASGRDQPSAYVRVVNAADYVSERFSSGEWNGSLFSRAPDMSESQERLVGADDGSLPPDAVGEAPDDLYQEIATLYSDSEDGYREEAAYEDAAAIDADAAYAQPDYGDEDTQAPTYTEEFSPEEAEKLASASGNG